VSLFERQSPVECSTAMTSNLPRAACQHHSSRGACPCRPSSHFHSFVLGRMGKESPRG
jgi:hypothetical protein